SKGQKGQKKSGSVQGCIQIFANSRRPCPPLQLPGTVAGAVSRPVAAWRKVLTVLEPCGSRNASPS
ncbi:MAG: hypothetical protein ACK53L_11125, partial [Pirellulaceae bacterium]